jgi:hypothetical protein
MAAAALLAEGLRKLARVCVLRLLGERTDPFLPPFFVGLTGVEGEEEDVFGLRARPVERERLPALGTTLISSLSLSLSGVVRGGSEGRLGNSSSAL